MRKFSQLILFVCISLCCFSLQGKAQYCTPTYTSACTSNDYIESFSFNTISNTNSGCNGNANNYIYYNSLSTNLIGGQSYTISMQGGSAYSQGFGVWIDFNKDNDFDDAGEFVYASPTYSTSVFTTNITIPFTVSAGTTRMRVRCKYNGTIIANESCSNMSYGETEDYNVLLLAATPLDLMTEKINNTNPILVGPNTISMDIRNVGTNTINTADVSYSLNGGAAITNSLSGLGLTTGQLYTQNFTADQAMVLAPGLHSLKVWTSKPNGTQPDSVPSNDTLSKILCTAFSLSGNFTLNPNGTGNRNFTNFKDLEKALKNCGMSGNVVVNVSPGVYETNVHLLNFLGSSPLARVTIQSSTGNASDVTIKSTLGVTLNIDSVSYLTLKNLTIENVGLASATGINITGASHDILIQNCNIKMAVGTTSSSVAGIVVTKGTSINTTDINAFNVHLLKNKISGGYYGIHFAGETSQALPGIYVDSNEVTEVYKYGMTFRYIGLARLHANKVVMLESTGSLVTTYGVAIDYCDPDTLSVSHNEIYNCTFEGLSIYSCITLGTKVFNNYISVDTSTSTSASAVYLYDTDSLTFAHNTVYLNGTSTGSEAMYIGSSHQGLKIFNNIFANYGVGYAYYVSSSSSGLAASDNNVLFTNGNNIGYYSGTKSNLTAFSAASGFDYNSLEANPMFVSPTNLKPTNPAVGNNGRSTFVKTDFEGEIRNPIRPDAGADEFATTDYDLAIANLSPNPPLPGPNTISVVLINGGRRSLANQTVTMEYSVNGGQNYTVAQTVLLSALDTGGKIQPFSFTTPWINPSAGSYDLCVRVKPNGVAADTIKGNEKLCLSGCILPGQTSDTLKVGPTARYSSINEAIAAITCGVTSAVVISVAPGDYYENVVIPEIPGVSAGTPLTITSSTSKATDVKIISDGGSTVQFNGADFVILRNVTVINKNNADAIGVHFKNRADFNTVENCIIHLDSSVTSSDLIGIAALVDENTEGGDNGNNLTIRNNEIYGGYYGIQLHGLNAYVHGIGGSITGNKILNPYYYGISLDYYDIYEISKNQILFGNRRSNFSMAMLVVYCFSDVVIDGNKIVGPGAYGINLSTLVPPSGFTVSNNMISGEFSSTSSRGISLNLVENGLITYNSVDIYVNSTSSTARAALYSSGAISAKIVNNTLSFKGPRGYAYYIGTGSGVYESNFNNYYTEGPDFAYWESAVPTLGSLQAKNSKDANSISIKPLFFKDNDLHTKNPGFDKKGTPVLTVTHDYDNQDRDAETPDIGADEFEIFNVDAAIADILNPVLVPGNNTISFQVRNEGLSSLNGLSLSCSYSADSGQTWSSPQVFTLSNLANFGDVSDYSFSSLLNISNRDKRNVCVRINVPLVGDGDQVNDMICENFCIGLAGTFSVGGPSADFIDLDQAIGELSCGIGGPVVFNINPSIYTNPVTINNYLGASATNTVTFQSATGNPNDVVFSTSGVSSSNHSTIQFNGSRHIVLKKLTIENTGTSYASGVHFTNNAQFNRVEACIIKLDTNITSSNTAGILSSTPTSFTGSGTNASNNTIIGNTIQGGYYGIRFYSSSSTHDDGNRVIGNRVEKWYYYGIYMYYNDKITVDSNIASPREQNSGFARASYLNYSNGDGSVSGNKFQRNLYMGIHLNYVVGSTEFIVKNNMIGSGFTNSNSFSSGILVDGVSSKIGVYNNTVLFDGPSTFSAALHVSNVSSSQINIRNNLLKNISGGYALDVPSGSVLAQSNYNNFHTNGNNLIYFGGDFPTLADYQTASGFDANSLNINVEFATPFDLHTKDAGLNAKAIAISNVKQDYDGQLRHATTPDIGADEFDPISYDLAVVDALPSYPVVGSNTVKAVLRNDGLLSLKDSVVKLAYSIDGGSNYFPSQSYTIKGLSQTFDLDTMVFTLPWTVSAEGNFDLCVKIVAPGLSVDSVLDNNIICKNVCVAKSGVFTVGGTSPNFTTITEAIASITCGVSGPVVLNIRPGTYNEQVLIPLIGNTSATNTFTIQSETGNPADVIINYPGTSSSNFATIQLNAARYVNIRNITVVNMGSTYSAGIHMANSANNNEIRNVKIFLDSTSTGSSRNGIVSSSLTGVTTNARSAHNNKIVGNTIVGGYYGIALRGENSSATDKGNSVDSNTIRRTYYYGMYFYYQSPASINGNIVSSSSANRSSSYRPFHMYYSSGDFIVSNNRFTDVGYYGMYLISNNATNKIIFKNNMIGGGFTSSFGSAIYLSGNNGLSFINNSINMDISATSNEVVYITFGNSNLEFYNNSFANTGGGYVYYISSSSYVSSVIASDHNNLYTTGGSLSYWGGSTSATLNNHKTNTGKDQNSVSVDPQYTSTLDLHTTSPAMDKAAKKFEDVTIDIDGDPRSAFKPDIGADEFILSAVDLAVFNIKPEIASFGENTIKVTLLNEGVVSLKDTLISLSYSLDSGKNWTTPEVYAIKNLSQSYDSEEFTFNKKWNNTERKGYMVCVRVNVGPNADNNALNDTICASICTGLSGGVYTIGGTSPDFISISTAMASVSCGITGDVTFLLRDGTYNERLSIGDITGVSNYKITIKSESGNPEDVVIKSSGGNTDTDHHTVRFLGTKNVTIRDLTVVNTAVQRSSGIHIASGSKNVKVINCIVKVDSLTDFNTNTGIYISGYEDSYYAAGKSDSIRIENNLILGGYYGIRIIGVNQAENKGIILKNNTINRSNVAGIRTQAAQMDTIQANRILMRPSNDQSVGIVVDRSPKAMYIDGNYVAFAGSIGMLVLNSSGNLYSQISNNMIAGGFRPDGINGDYGLGIIASSKFNIYHNSVLMDGSHAQASALYLDNANNIKGMNNILYNSKNGYVMQSINGSTVLESDFNNLFAEGSVFAKVETDNFADLNEFQNATTLEASSISIQPNFKGQNDLHLNQASLNNLGNVLPAVTRDYDNQARNTENPDMGADEFELSGFVDAGIKSITAPIEGAAVNGPVEISVIIANYGTNNISQFSISYTVDGTTVTENIFDTIPGNSDKSYTFNRKWNPSKFGDFQICAYTSVVDDINLSNDQTCLNVVSLDTIDISMATMVLPKDTIIGNTSEVRVTVSNNGNKIATAFPITYKFDGYKVTELFNDTLGIGETKSFKFVESIVTFNGGDFTFCVYTGLQNDFLRGNDTICRDIFILPDTPDLAITEFIRPGESVDSAVKPAIIIANLGNNPLYKYRATLFFNGIEVNDVVLTDTLLTGQTMEHTFDYTIDPITGAKYELIAIVNLFGDVNKSNDTLKRNSTAFLGIHEFGDINLEVFPVPADDNLSITGLNSSHAGGVIMLSDESGKKVKSYTVDGIGKLEILTKNLPSGNYFLTYHGKEGTFFKKIQIIH